MSLVFRQITVLTFVIIGFSLFIRNSFFSPRSELELGQQQPERVPWIVRGVLRTTLKNVVAHLHNNTSKGPDGKKSRIQRTRHLRLSA